LNARRNTPYLHDSKPFLALPFHCLNISSCHRSLLCSTKVVVEVLETNAVSSQSITKIPILVRRFRRAHRKLYLVWISHNLLSLLGGRAVVKALRYKPVGRGFDSRWCHSNFSVTYSFRSHCGHGVDSASNRNEYQEYFLGGKGGRCVRLTTLPPSCAVVMKSGNLNFLEPSGPLQACNGTALPFYYHC